MKLIKAALREVPWIQVFVLAAFAAVLIAVGNNDQAVTNILLAILGVLSASLVVFLWQRRKPATRN